MVVVTGGFVTTAAGVRVSARSPIPALTAAAFCLLVWQLAAWRARGVVSDLESVDAWLQRNVRSVVAFVAALAAITAIAFNSFSATGSDASGYLSHTEMLLAGNLSYDEPLARIAKWRGGEATLVPLGWIAKGGGIQVPTYSVGLPALMAPFYTVGGATVASLLIPISFAAAVVLVAALAHRVAGGNAAIVAATWFATSPVALVESMHVMSDVPVTAAWMLCWWLLFTKRPLASGLAAAIAVLIRPNLAPLAALPALYAVVAAWDRPSAQGRTPRPSPHRVAYAARFLFPIAVAGAITAYLQWRWFGSPLRSGYGAANEIYSLANVAPNAALYVHWLIDAHGPWLLLAPLAVLLASQEWRWLLLFGLAVVAAYLPYAQFEVWTYLRFLLPALAVGMIAVAAIASGVLNRLASAIRGPLLIVLIVVIASANVATAKQLDVFRFAERHVRGRVVGERLAATLPVNAVIVSGEQSGAMRYYTHRTILRWEVMDEAAMRDAMDWLTLNGYQLWVVLDDWEEEPFRRKLPGLAAMALDYEPTVESAAGVGIRTRAWRARILSARSSNNE